MGQQLSRAASIVDTRELDDYEVPDALIDGTWSKGVTNQDMSCMIGARVPHQVNHSNYIRQIFAKYKIFNASNKQILDEDLYQSLDILVKYRVGSCDP